MTRIFINLLAELYVDRFQSVVSFRTDEVFYSFFFFLFFFPSKQLRRNKILKSFLDDDTQFHEYVEAGDIVKRNFHFIRASISSDNSVPVEPEVYSFAERETLFAHFSSCEMSVDLCQERTLDTFDKLFSISVKISHDDSSNCSFEKLSKKSWFLKAINTFRRPELQKSNFSNFISIFLLFLFLYFFTSIIFIFIFLYSYYFYFYIPLLFLFLYSFVSIIFISIFLYFCYFYFYISLLLLFLFLCFFISIIFIFIFLYFHFFISIILFTLSFLKFI